jgi:hypothetical protein
VYNYFHSQNSSVSIVTRQWAGQTRKAVLIPSSDMTSYLLQSTQKGSRAHPASCTLVQDVLSAEVKWMGYETDHPPPSGAEVKNE